MTWSIIKNPLTLICGLSVALVSCTAAPAQRGERPRQFLSVQPIQVCNSFGIFCADLALFEDETQKIWSQVDIEVDFLEPVQLNATRFLTIDSSDEFAELSFSGGVGAFGRHPLSTRTSGPINMWFVETISTGLFDAFGLAWIDQNGILISDDILDFNNGIGRLDTVAHEIGHNLGLTHSNFGAGPATNLMSDGSVRNVPSSSGDITPDGARLSQLNGDQADFARGSSLVTSDPGSFGGGETSPPPPFPPFLDAMSISDSAPLATAARTGLADSQPSLPPPQLADEYSMAMASPPAEVSPAADRSEPVAAPFNAVQATRPQGYQQVPNGPAMSFISAVILAGFLRLQNRRHC
jgi:hypothetical protein